MTSVSELLVNLKNFAVQYFLLTVIDHERFSVFMENFYYYNGVVGLDVDSPKTNYIISTSYKQGLLMTDPSKDIFFEEGVLIADTDENVTTGVATLSIP